MALPILPPIVSRVEKAKGALRPLLLEALTRDPDLTDLQLSTIIGVSEKWIRAMRRSDTFQHDLAKRIRERYGPLLDTVRTNTLETHAIALKRLNTNLRDDSLTPAEHLAAAELALEHSEKVNFQGPKSHNPNDPAAPGNNVTINIVDLHRARDLALQHSKALTVIPNEVEGRDSPLIPVVREEGDAV